VAAWKVCAFSISTAFEEGAKIYARRKPSPNGHQAAEAANENGLHRCKPLIYMVAGDGIEPPTRGFSISFLTRREPHKIRVPKGFHHFANRCDTL
jgi:hypothetical protein